MNIEKLKQSVLDELYKSVSLQNTDGSFPSGHNGPYGDIETPIRNTAHFLKAYCLAYEISQDNSFRKVAIDALDFLLTSYGKQDNFYFLCRQSKTKDDSNGVIGNAWVIESLIQASQTLNSKEAKYLALILWREHKFNFKLGIWAKPKSTDGVDYDFTFNHQLWFAASIAKLNHPRCNKEIACFIRNNFRKNSIYSDGVIFHKALVGKLSGWLLNNPLVAARFIINALFKRKKRSEFRLHSVGYHGFNIHALAMLYNHGYASLLEKHLNINKLLGVTLDGRFIEQLKEYKTVGYNYNPSGLEIAFGWLSFKGDKKQSLDWIKRQFHYTTENQGLLTKGSPDRYTSKARIYEALDILIFLESHKV